MLLRGSQEEGSHELDCLSIEMALRKIKTKPRGAERDRLS
jgi:hypothetical protein